MDRVDGQGRPGSGGSERGEPAGLRGARLGQYLIVEPLGVGGMGEVWRAQDTRLGREVALKMLPRDLAEGSDRMARLTHEARVLASLNHPNVAALYGLEHLPLSELPDAVAPGPPAAGEDERFFHFLVMELVEGEGLDEIVARGPMPFREAVSIALQVGQGLQAAHERGVVHRDLKPANIRVRADGTVKVLDFGLATTRDEIRIDDDASQSPTTEQYQAPSGAIVGTVSYMSPEQARGRPVDRRADIWAFGCLLFEMLTGAKAFRGDTLSDTMAAVLKDEPSWSLLPADLEPVARHVLRRCLTKDPARRFHDIADVRIELEEAASVAVSHRHAERRGGRIAGRWPLVLATAAIAVAAAAGVAVLARRSAPAVSLPTFRAMTFQSARVAGARFAPDGRTVVFAMSTGARPLELMSTRTDSVESRPLDLPPADILGISGNGQMAILLDRHSEGSWVSVGTLATADLAGGPARAIAERVNDGDISADGSSLAIVREVAGVQRLEYPLGTVLFETHGWISSVRIAPDGTHVAFLHHPFYGDDRGMVLMVDTGGTVTRLTDDLSDSLQGLAWAPDGRSVWFTVFVFGQGGVLWSVRPGEPPVARLRTPIASRIQDVATDGRVLLVSGDTRAEIAGLLAGQTEERQYEGWNDDSIGGLAEDGSMFAGNIQVGTVDGEYTAFARRADGSPAIRLGHGTVFGMSPSGDLVFARRMTGDRTHIVVLPTGPGEPGTIDLGGVRPDSASTSLLTCSADGRRATFAGFRGDVGPRIYMLDLVDGTVQPFGPVGIQAPVISPDGTRAACVGPDGAVTVYAFPGGEAHEVPGVRPGERPLQWTLDGRGLLVWNRAFPARIARVQIGHAARSLAMEIMPKTPAGVLYGQIIMSPDGRYYVYRYRRDVSTLFLVDGVR